MIKLLMIVATWRLMRALARILALVVIGGLLLGYLSSAGHGQRAQVTRLRHAVLPIERQLQHALEQAVKR
jgi:hypothetical protein